MAYKESFLVGNGFDINIGLKTSYADFYKYIMLNESEKFETNNIYRSIRSDSFNSKGRPILWSDVEAAIGIKLFALEYLDHKINQEGDLSQKDKENFIKFYNMPMDLDHVDDFLEDFIGQSNIDKGQDFNLTQHIDHKFFRDLNEFSKDFNSYLENHILKSFRQQVDPEHFLSHFFDSMFFHIINLYSLEQITLFKEIIKHGLMEDRIYLIEDQGQLKINIELKIFFQIISFNYTKILEKVIYMTSRKEFIKIADSFVYRMEEFLENHNIFLESLSKYLEENFPEQAKYSDFRYALNRKLFHIKIHTNIYNILNNIYNIHLFNDFGIFGCSRLEQIPEDLQYEKDIFLKAEIMEYKDQDYFLKLLNASNHLYIFGSSYGVSDRLYWEKILLNLVNNNDFYLSLNNYSLKEFKKRTPLERKRDHRKIRQDFVGYLSTVDLGDRSYSETLESISDRIFIGENINFSVFSPSILMK